MNSGLVAVFALNYFMRAVCFASAAFLAYHDKDGWGWLILAGIVTSISSEEKKEKSDKP